MKRSLVPCLVLLGLPAPAVAQDGAQGDAPGDPAPQRHFPADDDLTLMVRYLVEDGHAPGAVLGVRDPDGSTRVVHWGIAGPDSTPVGPDAVFEIGSVTKTFVGTLLADMVLKGEVSLDDLAGAYLPDGVRMPSRAGREITLLDLATHRSGLPNVPDDMRTPGRRMPDWEYTVEDAYAFLAEYELTRAPGARREYSNFGFGLLAQLLSRAAGQSFEELVRERILEPLDMSRTGFVGPDGVPAGTVSGHRDGRPVRYRAPWEIMAGSGGLYSTAGDLLKYADALIGPAESDVARAVRFAAEVRIPTEPEGAGAGLGWGTGVYPGEAPVVGHDGGTAGFSARFAVMPSAGTAMALLLNDNGFTGDLVPSLMLFEPPPVEWGSATVAPDGLRPFAGEYETVSGSGSYYVRMEDDGWLTYQPPRQARARLYALDDSTFYLLRGPWTFTFARKAEGETELRMAVDEREPSHAGRVQRRARKVSDETPPPRAVVGQAGIASGWEVGTWTLMVLAGLVAAGLIGWPLWLRASLRTAAGNSER